MRAFAFKTRNQERLDAQGATLIESMAAVAVGSILILGLSAYLVGNSNSRHANAGFDEFQKTVALLIQVLGKSSTCSAMLKGLSLNDSPPYSPQTVPLPLNSVNGNPSTPVLLPALGVKSQSGLTFTLAAFDTLVSSGIATNGTNRQDLVNLHIEATYGSGLKLTRDMMLGIWVDTTSSKISACVDSHEAGNAGPQPVVAPSPGVLPACAGASPVCPGGPSDVACCQDQQKASTAFWYCKSNNPGWSC